MFFHFTLWIWPQRLLEQPFKKMVDGKGRNSVKGGIVLLFYFRVWIRAGRILEQLHRIGFIGGRALSQGRNPAKGNIFLLFHF